MLELHRIHLFQIRPGTGAVADFRNTNINSSATVVSPLLVQRCGTVCLNSFSNRTSRSDNLNNRLKRLCLGSRAAADCG